MSGGSYDYGSQIFDGGDLLDKRRDLQRLVTDMASLGYAKDAATESQELLARLNQFLVWSEVSINRLFPVWRAFEWWKSMDTSEENFKETLEKYRTIP